MIRFIDGNIGIPFIKWAVGDYMYVTIATATIVTAALIGYGIISVNVPTTSTVLAYVRGRGVIRIVINTYSSVAAYLRAYALISVAINTFSTVSAWIAGAVVWVTEIINRASKITNLINRKSDVNGN